ncbi:MAG: cation:proton antiporter [Lacunisphaera sp.]
MPHDVTLITTIAVGFVLAFILGFVANKFRLPPLVGYLLAGVVMGQCLPGFMATNSMTSQLADIGVMLLMFGVGLHFSIPDLMAVRWVAIPGAVCQIVVATAMGTGMAMYFWGWTLGAGLVMGLCLSVASTVVLLKALDESNGVETPNGRIAIGWLIVEDLAMVVVLVLLPAFAGMLGGHVPSGGGEAGGSLLLSLGNTAIKVSAFVLILLFFGPKVMPWLLRQVARTGSRELFTLSVLAVSLGIAFGSAELFDVSFALGAFFAGVVLSESDFSHKAAANSLPLQDAFAVLFFVSVGMLFDPSILIREPMMVAGVVALILFGKALAALAIVGLMGYPLGTALTVAGALAQIGEFSFILAGLGVTYGLMPAEGVNLVLAGALISITLNPLVFALVEWIDRKVSDRTHAKARLDDRRAERFDRLRAQLDVARLTLEKKMHSHKTFSPEELVARFPLFAGLTPEQRETLILHFLPKTASPGERIIRSGDKAEAAYFLSAGEVEVAVRGRQISKMGAGSFFGEMALLSGDRRSADVTALDFCKYLALSQRDFRRFVRKYPSVYEQVEALAKERGKMNRQFLDDLAHGTAPPMA